MEKEREKRKITLVVWKDEYEAFKTTCHSERTTPTALINKFIREYPKKQQEN